MVLKQAGNCRSTQSRQFGQEFLQREEQNSPKAAGTKNRSENKENLMEVLYPKSRLKMLFGCSLLWRGGCIPRVYNHLLGIPQNSSDNEIFRASPWKCLSTITSYRLMSLSSGLEGKDQAFFPACQGPDCQAQDLLLLPKGSKAQTADMKWMYKTRQATPTKSHFQHFSYVCSIIYILCGSVTKGRHILFRNIPLFHRLYHPTLQLQAKALRFNFMELLSPYLLLS